jgi:hypothetical protein
MVCEHETEVKKGRVLRRRRGKKWLLPAQHGSTHGGSPQLDDR